MVAEALVALGRPEAVAPWVDRYRRRLEPAPGPGTPLVGDQWEGALGQIGRYADWVALFDGLLDEEHPDDILEDWVPRLAPGSIGAAAHGLIRTAHGARALAAADLPGRRHELAQGLAYWAARYQELPGPPLLLGRLTVPEALAGIPAVPEEAPTEDRISAQVRHVDMVAAPFEQAVSALAPRAIRPPPWPSWPPEGPAPTWPTPTRPARSHWSTR